MSFELEAPARTTRPGRTANNVKLQEGLTFATSHKGEWFVYSSEPLEEGVQEIDVNRVRARVYQRVSHLRRAAKAIDLNIEVAVRKDGSVVKGYARLIDGATGEGK